MYDSVILYFFKKIHAFISRIILLENMDISLTFKFFIYIQIVLIRRWIWRLAPIPSGPLSFARDTSGCIFRMKEWFPFFHNINRGFAYYLLWEPCRWRLKCIKFVRDAIWRLGSRKKIKQSSVRKIQPKSFRECTGLMTWIYPSHCPCAVLSFSCSFCPVFVVISLYASLFFFKHRVYIYIYIYK